jgi:hypothetical protein
MLTAIRQAAELYPVPAERDVFEHEQNDERGEQGRSDPLTSMERHIPRGNP